MNKNLLPMYFYRSVIKNNNYKAIMILKITFGLLFIIIPSLSNSAFAQDVLNNTNEINNITTSNNTTSNSVALKLPLTLSGTIYHYTNNNTKPQGTWIITGTWTIVIKDNKNANFTADVSQVRTGDKVSYQDRFEHIHQITNFKANSISTSNSKIIINGTADNIMNGEMRFPHIPISIAIIGGSAFPYSQIIVTQGGEAAQNANGATPWHGTVSQRID